MLHNNVLTNLSIGGKNECCIVATLYRLSKNK